jgi:ubiquinone/menaquinone biosynthesis C-methylase UbiE
VSSTDQVTVTRKDIGGALPDFSHTVSARRPQTEDLPIVSTEEGYRLWAATYDRDPNPLLALEERILAPLIPDVRTKTVLDLACGTGRWLTKLVNAGARHATGLDLSPAMLMRAIAKTELRGRVVRANCLSLPVRSETADLVMCSLAVGHILDLGRFAGEIARVANPNCDVYVTDLHPHAYANGWRSGFRHETGSREINTLTHSKDDLLNAFQARSFEPLVCLEPHFDMPERPLFERAGKAEGFNDLCRLPALLVLHFARR